MAWTNWGFDGTINEAQWSQMAGLLGNGYVAAGNGDCLVTAVGGARSVSVAAGTLYGDGVVSVNSAPETVAMTTPVNGQWYVIALRRTWATNTAALVAIAGATTTTTTPTAPPTSFPTLNTNTGVLTDQPIAWAWCNSANTTVVVYDIRLKAVKSLPPVVANANERDAKFMTPTQGLQVWRDDLGAAQTYFGLYNASTNPGGRDSAGWYTDTRAMGLVPIKPGSVVIATGSGSANSLGVVSFSGATAISLNNVFSPAYKNYKVVFEISASTANGSALFRFRNAGTDLSSTAYGQSQFIYRTNGTTQSNSGGGLTGITILGTGSYSGQSFVAVAEISNPYVTSNKSFEIICNGVDATGNYGAVTAGYTGSSSAYDGLTILPTAGNITGTIQVFGYND